MVMGITIVVGGYLFIFLSFVWTWLVSAMALPSVTPRRTLFCRQNVSLFLRIATGWTALGTGLLVLGGSS
jgi:hypothetical protein